VMTAGGPTAVQFLLEHLSLACNTAVGQYGWHLQTNIYDWWLYSNETVVSWLLTPCCLVRGYQHLRGTCHSHTFVVMTLSQYLGHVASNGRMTDKSESVKCEVLTTMVISQVTVLFESESI
jgi:hypothetical protein